MKHTQDMIHTRHETQDMRRTRHDTHKGPYKYYVITSGGVGGQGSLDDNDYALRGGKHQNDYILHEKISLNGMHVAYNT